MITPDELEYWRGQVDDKLKNIAETVTELKRDVKENVGEVKESIRSMTESVMGAIKENDRCGRREHQDYEKRIAALEVAHSYVKTKIAVGAAIAGILGGGVSSAAFGSIFHKLFGS